MQYAIDNDIIDLSYMQDAIEMNKREELLKKHPYKIWEGKNGKWYTYLPDDSKSRILIKRNTENAIQDIVIDYWKEEAENPTVKEIYDALIDGKIKRNEIKTQTKNRYDRQFNESCQLFGQRQIKSVTSYDIEDFMLNSISSHKLTQKGASNLRTIIRGIFKYAKKKGYVSFSISEILADMEISRKSYRKTQKDDDELVFSDEEFKKINQYIVTKNPDIKNLGILLVFYTGMRPGELAALQWTDIDDNIIHIQKMEERYERDDGTYCVQVRDFPKTETGIRHIIIPSNAIWIIKSIRRLNPFGTYIFEQKGKRITVASFDRRIRTLCKNVGITEKSINKIRKTYATILLDEGIDESIIISQMGHTDIETTKRFYYKDRNTMEHKRKVIDRVFEKQSKRASS